MKKAEAIQRITKLRALINDYRYHYHVLDESTMSEAAADSLKYELAQLEAAFPDLITPDSPTQRVAGQALDKFQKVRHQQRMVSLADIFSLSEIHDWLNRNQKLLHSTKITSLFTDIKMDGLACAIHYQDGLLTQAVTRGDGLVGEDVTMNVRTIKNVPLSIDQAGHVEVRGEIVIFNQDFARLNQAQLKKGAKPFANPRNLAAGSIRQLDPQVAAARPLQFIAYDLVTPNLPSFDAAYTKLRSLGFRTSGEHTTWQRKGETFFASTKAPTASQPKALYQRHSSDLFAYITALDTYRQSLAWNTDGLVIKINDRGIFQQLGIVGKTPRAAIAFKFPAEESTSVVRDIVISIGRTGAATPVAILDPVQLAGSTVQHASLHNADEIARLDLRVGDTVVVYKAGDIIPQIKTVLTALRLESSQAFDYQAALKTQYPELQFERPAGEVVYRVKGASSDLLLKRAVEYYASKAGLDIAGLGKKNVLSLVDNGLLHSLADLYRLEAAQVAKLEGFAELSAQNLINAINASKRPPLHKFITALGIRHVGAQTAVALAKQFGSITALSQATQAQLLSVPDIGQIVAESILAWFADEDNTLLLQDLAALGLAPQHQARSKLSGQSYIITGSLSTMERSQAEDRLRSLGAQVTSSVTKQSTALIVGTKPGAAKLNKARSLGVKTISETDFLKLIAE